MNFPFGKAGRLIFWGELLVLGSVPSRKLTHIDIQHHIMMVWNTWINQRYYVLIGFLVVPKLTIMDTKNDGLENVSPASNTAIYGTQLSIFQNLPLCELKEL